MDPLEEHHIPPPAYCEQEFDRKTLRATELSLELAKWEIPKLELDEEGFPRYDPALFEDTPAGTQKGKDQPTTFRSPSINKRPLPLPNPKPSTSSSNAGPSTLRQTAPLHISKKSITKAEEAARDATFNIPAYTPNPKSIPSQGLADPAEDYPPYTARNSPPPTSSLKSIHQSVVARNLPASTPNLPSTPNQASKTRPEENPPYATWNIPISNPLLSSISSQSIEDTPEANPPYTASNLPPVSSRQSFATHSVPEDNPPYDARDLPVSDPHLQSVTNQSVAVTPEDNPPYASRTFPVSMQSSNQVEDILEDNPPYTAVDPISNQSNQRIGTLEDNPPYAAVDPISNQSNQRIDTLEDNPPYAPDYAAEPPYDEQPAETWEENGTTLRQEVRYEPIPEARPDRPQSVGLEMPRRSTQSRELLTPNTVAMANQMPNLPSRYSISPIPPPLSSPQHLSLPPAPRNPPRIITSDRPRSQSTTPSSALSHPSANDPRVVFNPNVAYGRNLIGGARPQIRPIAQTPQTNFDPHLFYNSVVSSHLSAPMTVPDQSPHLPYQQVQPQVWPSHAYSSPPNQAINQSHQWRWHPPDRPSSNVYGSVPDSSCGRGGTDMSRYSHYPMTNNGYFNR